MPPKTKKAPVDYGSIKLRERLGIAEWQLNALIRHGQLENPPSRRWTAEVVDELQARLPEALAAIGPQGPLGASRCAQLAAELLDLNVEAPDIEELVERGLLAPAVDYLGKTIYYKDWALYDVLQVREVVLRERDLVEDLVAERTAWMESSRNWHDVRKELGWSFEEMRRVTDERKIVSGRFGRITSADAAALLGDEELDEAVRGARLVGPTEAAQHAELRPIDFKYCRAAGWISPASWGEVKVSRGKWIEVPYYRIADVEALVQTLAEMPNVNLERLRGLGKGEASPLREIVAMPTSRGVFVRGFAADFGEKHGVTVSAVYEDRRDRWTLSWTPNAEGQPSEPVMRQAILADKDLKPHSRHIVLRVDQDAVETA